MYTSTMNKQTLLKQTDPITLINCITSKWSLLLDEEEQELCLEEIYDFIANSATRSENFNLLSNDEKAQHEIDVDMLLITIEFKDLAEVLFHPASNEALFWSSLGEKESALNSNIYKALFM